MNQHRKCKVLFLCTGNSARSILGEFLLRSMDSRFETYSAGAEPTGEVHPMALKVLRDVYDVDAAGAESKSWQAVAGVDFDVVITVCDHARDTCPILPGSSAILAHWGSEDPARASGDEAAAVFRQKTEAAFRRVAAEIYRRLERFCALPWERLDDVSPASLRKDEHLAEQLRRIGTD